MNREHSLFWRIFYIAFPVALQSLITTGVAAMDTLMIGNISEVQLSAVAQGNQPYFLFSTTIFGLATGSTVLTAQYWGKGELDPIRAIMGLILRVGMIAGALLGALVLAFPAAVMSIFTNDPQVIASGVEFLRIIAFSYVFAAFTGVFLISLRSMENVRVSLCIYGLSFALNLVLHWVFIFGNLGAPRMEIRGAALATLISRIYESVMVLVYMYCIEKKVRFSLRDLFRPTRTYWFTVVRYSVPVLCSEMIWAVGISLQAVITGRLGVSALAAISFISMLQELAMVPVMGVGVAAGVITGNLIGQGKDEEALRTSKTMMKIGVVFGIVVGLILVLLRPVAPGFVAASPETAGIIRGMMFVAAYLLFCQSINIVTLAGVLRGSGDTAFCAGVDAFIMVVFKLVLGFSSAFLLHFPPVWVYFLLSSDELGKLFFILPRMWGGKWIHHTTV